VPTLSRIAAVLAAVARCAPGLALARTTTLAGAALMLLGVGLRLRTADAEPY
jgi:hypothetical protein